MPGVRLQKFLGKAPRNAPELLPDTSSQVATNTKLYSGDLIPYPEPVNVGSHGLVGVTPQTLHALYHPVTGDLQWLVWDKDVDIATPSGSTNVDEQRFYYTGDGAPKVSTYDLATTGSPPFPVDYYDLGLPLPTVTPTTVAASFSTNTTASYERDINNLVTITTVNDHGFKTGAFVTVSGFRLNSGTYTTSTRYIVVNIADHNLVVGSKVMLVFKTGSAKSGTYPVTSITNSGTFRVDYGKNISTSGDVDWDISSINATSVKIVVTGPKTFTYTSYGFQSDVTPTSEGSVDIAGDEIARSYLYTWYTPWGEESIGSEPATELYVREGQTITVSGLPTARPAGKNYIRGIRLYRTLATVTDTEYMRLGTLWFPVTVTDVTGTTVTTAEPHNLIIGGRFKISTGVSGGKVTDVLDDFRFTYSGGSGSGGTGGTLYHDVSENPGTTTARYWGDGSYDFVDDFNVASLLNALVTDDYAPPPKGLHGLTLFNNNVLVGFVGNELYFSEPKNYHAWPRDYKKVVPYDIVGLEVFSGYLLIVTESYPYILSGTDPAILNITRIDVRYPCLNKRSIVNMGFGVIYATHDGLALYSTTVMPQLATRLLYSSDTWNADLDPRTLNATAYKDAYIGWHSTGGIAFEQDEQVGGYFVDLSMARRPEAMWYDPRTNNVYYTTGTAGDVYQWDDLAQPSQTYSWKSKVIVTENPINLGAAQVDADYKDSSPIWDAFDETWGGAAGQWDIDGGITFKMWVNGDLIVDRPLDSRAAFRLPQGYRSDTFEVGVEGSVRLKAIRLAETPTGLGEV